MNRGARRKHSGLLAVVFLLTMGLVMLIASGCGGSDSKADSTTTTAVSSTSSGGAGSGADGKGAALGAEIIDTFDGLIAKVADLVKDKPEPAVVKPKLQELYASYEPIMKELNTRYRALKDAELTEFQACSRYITDARPKSVNSITDIMLDPIKYYNFDLGDQETLDLITKKPIELLDMAVAQN